jgi:hypothetical protein
MRIIRAFLDVVFKVHLTRLPMALAMPTHLKIEIETASTIEHYISRSDLPASSESRFHI